jgi:DNA-binding NtrC family response regulator
MSAERRPDQPPSPPRSDLRWQAYFQRCRQPLFLLDHQRRIRFVNQAWEALTGLPASEVRGRVCSRRAAETAGGWPEIRRALAPPVEALHGRSSRVRRCVAMGWWDIDFLPLGGDDGILGILGQIHPLPLASPPGPASWSEALARLHHEARALQERSGNKEELWTPEAILALGQRVPQRHAIEQLGSDLPALRQAADQVRLAAQCRAPVLIVGEAGTGKKWLARAIHFQNSAPERPFAVADCAHLPPEALAALLFGGGPLRGTQLGTLYLREPALLPRDLQARLCDLLTGDGEKPPAGVRVIAGSRLDLVEAARSGQLLEELRCALSTIVIRLPPLRERWDDLPRLVEQMLSRALADQDCPSAGLSPEAWELLRAYPWPGNLRQLYSVLASAGVRAHGALIETSHLPAYLRLAVRLEPAPQADDTLPLDRLLAEAERRLILLALERTGGHRARAADLLGIQRPRLWRRMRALGLSDEGATEEDEVPIEPEE